VRFVLALARTHPGRSLLTLACLLLAGLAEGVGLSTMLPLLDLAVPGAAGEDSPLAEAVRGAFVRVGLEPTLGMLLVFVVAGIAGKAALILLANRQVGYTVARIATELRLALVRALLGARWEYYTRQPVGVVANAFATEAERASQAYLHGTLLVSAALQALVYTGVAFAVSWRATLASLGVGLLTSLALTSLVRAAKRAGRRQTELLKLSLARLADVLQAVKPLRAMAREALMGPLLERETQLLDRAVRGEVLSKEGLKALQEPILVTTLAAGVFVAITRFGFPLAQLLVLGLLFARALGSINKVQKEYQSLAVRESAYTSLRQTIERAEGHREADAGGLAPRLEQGIALEGVGLSYGERRVLGDVSLEIPAGRLTALVGPSGAGKTSIADLVIGLVRPDRGAVLVDGVPLERMDLRRWRSWIGYVPQELFLLHDTVFVNVTLGDPDLGAEDVWRALREAGAAEFVERLAEGLDTVVGERGSLLSGGQRQRIAIARALVRRPRLLLLDEATTALDPETEAAVCASVARLRGEMTILAISHEPALVEMADRVWRVENGTAKRVDGSAAPGPPRAGGA
jgi:ATP-binding cassette subfamily C protein